MFGDFPVKSSVYTPCIDNSGQPYILIVLVHFLTQSYQLRHSVSMVYDTIRVCRSDFCVQSWFSIRGQETGQIFVCRVDSASEAKKQVRSLYAELIQHQRPRKRSDLCVQSWLCVTSLHTDLHNFPCCNEDFIALLRGAMWAKYARGFLGARVVR
jgi:hypothetical protein